MNYIYIWDSSQSFYSIFYEQRTISFEMMKYIYIYIRNDLGIGNLEGQGLELSGMEIYYIS